MKTLVIFYSYNGATRQLARQLAEAEGADLYEVLDQKRPSLVGTFLRCPGALRQASGKVQPIEVDFSAYERFIVMGPIWASHPAPPVNNILRALPKGSAVELRMASAGGSSAKEKVTAFVQELGCTVADYQDIATGKKPGAEAP
ncbi:MAG: flavodoxin family protein [Oscillospiraceae bacterium]